MAYSALKGSVDALNTINSKECYMSFNANGFSIACLAPLQSQSKKSKKARAEPGGRSQANYEFYGKRMYVYDYRLVTSEMKPISTSNFIVNTQDFFLRLKGLKSKKISMLLEFDKNNECNEIAFSVSGSSSVTYLAIVVPERNTTHVDQLEAWFKGRDPVFKASCDAFGHTIQSAKHNKCEDIEFCLYKRTKNFSARCWKKDVMLFASPMSEDMNASFEEDLPNEPVISKHVNLAQNTWMDHIHSLCPGSIVDIYIREDPESPLILTTLIGNQGLAVHAIPDLAKD